MFVAASRGVGRRRARRRSAAARDGRGGGLGRRGILVRRRSRDGGCAARRRAGTASTNQSEGVLRRRADCVQRAHCDGRREREPFGRARGGGVSRSPCCDGVLDPKGRHVGVRRWGRPHHQTQPLAQLGRQACAQCRVEPRARETRFVATSPRSSFWRGKTSCGCAPAHVVRGSASCVGLRSYVPPGQKCGKRGRAGTRGLVMRQPWRTNK